MIVRRTRWSTVGDRAFLVAVIRVWNELLPHHITSALSLQVYCNRLMPHLFSLSLPDFCGACEVTCVIIGHFKRCCCSLRHLLNCAPAAGDAAERRAGSWPAVWAVFRGDTKRQVHIPGGDASCQAGLVRSAATLAAQMGRRTVVRCFSPGQSHLQRWVQSVSQTTQDWGDVSSRAKQVRLTDLKLKIKS